LEALVAELLQADEGTLTEAIRAGLAESLSNGITTVGDISRSGHSLPLLAEAGLKGTVFVEMLGFHPLMEREVLDRTSEILEKLPCSSEERLLFGITPHAPYSTSPTLYREAIGLARRRGLPVAVHVAETSEEELFVREGRGPLRDMLERFGLWHEDFSIPRCSPVAYLDQLGALEGALAIHCNEVDEEDIAILKSAGARVVVCPGSNAWFGRPARHPLPKLLKEGVTCALGTDSLASNDRLDMLNEMGSCAAAHPELSWEEVLRMATVSAAEAIGLGGLCGSLEAGKSADLVALRLPRAGVEEPLPWVVAEATGEAVALVVLNGAVAHNAT
jgi:5-methylthioadenosine/S-adenosylhomocysteine deaminase